jgi:hypothetical protein
MMMGMIRPVTGAFLFSVRESWRRSDARRCLVLPTSSAGRRHGSGLIVLTGRKSLPCARHGWHGLAGLA